MQNQKTSSLGQYLSRIFNVAPHEIPRILLAWSVKFLFMIGFTIGWTMLTAMLVGRLGIGYLPLLYIANAGLVIFSTIFFSELIHRVGKRILTYLTIACGVILLVSAVIAFHATGDARVFLLLALVAESVFFAQLNILLSLFIEDLFSPLESARAFPLVETSEYIGGIVGGLLILGGLSFFHMEAFELSFIWLAAIALIFPLLLLAKRISHKLPTLESHTISIKGLRSFQKFREGGKQVKKIPFLASLAAVVMLQWMFLTMLNFQYTEALDTRVTQSEEASAATHAAAPAANNHEELLTHGLSLLHIAFYTLALFTQLFLTSRVIGKLGIVKTLRLHPMIASAATVVMTLKFSFGSAVATKGLFEATTGIYNSAYHSSFYALKESVREHAKEFLEGLIRPLGVALGTGALLALQRVFAGYTLSFSINLTLLAAAVAMSYLLTRGKQQFTAVSQENLSLAGNHPAKFNSVEILSRPGHEKAAEILVAKLFEENESELLRVKILTTLGKMSNPATIPAILECFRSESENVKLAAVEALGDFRKLEATGITQIFTHHQVIDALKDLFQKENSPELRNAITRVFAKIGKNEIADFLLETLAAGGNGIRADILKVCAMFEDPGCAHYIEPYLTSDNPAVKANAIVALWKFPHYRLKLTPLLAELLAALDKPTQKAAIYTLGEIQVKAEEQRLLNYLAQPEDAELRLLAALALAKMQHSATPRILANYILQGDETLSSEVKKQLVNLPREIQKEVERIIHYRLSHQLHRLLIRSEVRNITELPREKLEEYRKIYATAADWEEVAKVDALLTGVSLD
ncbi:MAG: MFS transporter [Candidatus Gracilibacteria bacterium]|jgi:HEAT repeat protein